MAEKRFIPSTDIEVVCTRTILAQKVEPGTYPVKRRITTTYPVFKTLVVFDRHDEEIKDKTFTCPFCMNQVKYRASRQKIHGRPKSWPSRTRWIEKRYEIQSARCMDGIKVRKEMRNNSMKQKQIKHHKDKLWESIGLGIFSSIIGFWGIRNVLSKPILWRSSSHQRIHRNTAYFSARRCPPTN